MRSLTRSQSPLGFTFLEILVVVTVMAAMMALVLPQMGGLTDGARLRSSTRSLSNMFKVARTEAILGSRAVEVFLDLKQHSYRLDLRVPDGRESAERLTGGRSRRRARNIEQPRSLETRVRFDEVSASSGQIVGESEVVVRFHADGSATPTVITLVNHRGQRSTLEVLRLTGLTETRAGGPPSSNDRWEDEE